MKDEYKYYCESCGSIYDITADLMLCPKCRENDISGKPLKGVLKVHLPAQFKKSKSTGSFVEAPDYFPVEREFFPPLPVGNTPLVKAVNIEKQLGYENIYLKYGGTNPTGSYKDRASYLVSAFANKYDIKNIAVASTGNAASSMAGIAAAAGQKAFIFMPDSAPKAKLVQCLQYGAELIPVKGTYDDAFDLSIRFSNITGFLNRNTAYNPMTIEGKKSASFEIANSLSGKNIDYVFVPVGDGVVLSGIIKGFSDLKFLGVIDKMPVVIGVQAEGSSFIFNAFTKDKFDYDYRAVTLADSISVNIARNAITAVNDLRKVNGKIITVSDEEILNAQKYLAGNSGIFCEPSSAASFAGFFKIKNELEKERTIVFLLTGSGLKDIDNALKSVTLPQAYEADIDEILGRLNLKV